MSLKEPSQDFSTQPSPENSARKRPVSERRIQANRRNALRSTGPKTARGKRTVARNAIKHGLLAREVVITAGDGKENLEDFDSLVDELWECYEPVGVVEELLVQQIASCYWRKARVIRAENGEIRRPLDALEGDRAFQNSDNANLGLVLTDMDLGLYGEENQADQQVSTRERWSAMQVAQGDLRRHRVGLTYLSSLLLKAKSEIGSDGYMSENIRQKIRSAFCFWDYLFAHACIYAVPPEAKMEDRLSEKDVEQQVDERRADLVKFIDQRLQTLRDLAGYAAQREKLATDAEARSLSLPPADTADKLLRYEAHLDKQLYRAMDQLERQQRRRRGENVPPPLTIHLGRKN